MPSPRGVPRLYFPDAISVNHLRDQALQVGIVEIELKVADGAPNVSWDQVQQHFRSRRDAADAELGVQHQDRHLGAAKQVDEIAVEPSQLRVPIVQLLV